MKTEPITSGELHAARANSGRYETPHVIALRTLQNLNKYSGFSIGDVLIKKTDGAINKVEGGIPQRYVVIHKDTEGFVYVKRFLKGNGLSMGVDCITLSSNAREAYEIDAMYANSVILEDETIFNPHDDVKKARKLREKVRRINRKNTLDFKGNVELAINFIDTLKVGDKLWNDGGAEVTVKEIKIIDRKEKIATSSYGYLPRYEERLVPGKTSREVILELNSHGASRKYPRVDTDIEGLMTAKPVSVKDIQQ